MICRLGNTNKIGMPINFIGIGQLIQSDNTSQST